MESTEFPYALSPHTSTASFTINTSHPCGTFVTIDEPTLTHHYQLKSIVHIRAIVKIYITLYLNTESHSSRPVGNLQFLRRKWPLGLVFYTSNQPTHCFSLSDPWMCPYLLRFIWFRCHRYLSYPGYWNDPQTDLPPPPTLPPQLMIPT